jgi:putative sterol carrier protein
MVRSVTELRPSGLFRDMKIKSIMVLLAIALVFPWQDVRGATVAEILNSMPDRFGRQNVTDFNATIKYVISGEGVWHVAVSGGRMVVSENDLPADATITMSAEDFEGMVSGTLDTQTALITGRIRVEGDLNTVMRFQSLLGP